MPTPKHVYIEGLLVSLADAVKQREWRVVRNISKDLIKVDPENSEGRKYLIEAEHALRKSRFIPNTKERIDALPAGSVFYLLTSLLGAVAFFVLFGFMRGTTQNL